MSTPRIMPNGEIHYPRKGTPPLDIRGYKRKNANPASADAFKFVPDFPICAHRITLPYERGCGMTSVHIVCGRTKAICVYENWNTCPDLVQVHHQK